MFKWNWTSRTRPELYRQNQTSGIRTSRTGPAQLDQCSKKNVTSATSPEKPVPVWSGCTCLVHSSRSTPSSSTGLIVVVLLVLVRLVQQLAYRCKKTHAFENRVLSVEVRFKIVLSFPQMQSIFVVVMPPTSN